ncbi:histidine kinase [Nocardioides sp.]|uniref:sensor histidine kinase n=1 Tax=Nocardioides sp. TaxID=35761 RepID=UPI001A2E85EA|nr:histidine kinase [Nocardioides sp.]MBJ7357881.1 histidine kinase [Nocardioides sp.]
MDRPQTAEYQPRLSLWSHAWRLALCLSVSAVGWLPVIDDQSETQWALDIVLGVTAYVLVFGFRRRWPVPIAALVCLASAGSGIAAGAASLATVSVATRRRWREIAVVGSIGFAAGQFFVTWQPGGSEEPVWLLLGINAVATAALLAWGMYIGSRRELMWTLRNRAERAEAEQELRVAQSRSTERERIAREMHDVLAHRISQISMHAGALAFREDLTADEMRDSASVIRDKAHEALTDLRGVLGVLRDGSGELTHAPLPTYADVPALVEEARQSGMTVHLDDGLDPGQPVPDAVGRTIYRIVQEGLTNAHKHAPGSTLTIELSGSPEEGIDVVLRNPLGFGSTTPGSGLGLVGLTERAELRGGRLEHGRDGSAFVLRGWIPWAA